MRMILGLDSPDSGTATINGQKFHHLKAPMSQVGSLLEAKAVHPGRTAKGHLKALAAVQNLPARRVDEVIDLTGLRSVATKRVGGFSLGMGQRLGIAAALLGDPQTVILDEPVNCLDPEGVAWVRNTARDLAAEGRTVFLSSHLMSEMAQTADHVVVIGKGKILADAPISEFINSSSQSLVRVKTANPAALQQVVTAAGGTIATASENSGLLNITDLTSEQIAQIAMANGILLTEITPIQSSLEEAYLQLTNDSVEYQTGGNR
jgi:ABC-2 type transport system ATP-binding protein